MPTNGEILVKMIPAKRWRVSKALRPLWKNYNVFWLGNSCYPIQWGSYNTPLAWIEFPYLLGLPAYMHTICQKNQARLGPLVAVVVADFLGGEKPFAVQTRFITELTEHANARGVMVYVVTPRSTLTTDGLDGYTWTAGKWIKQHLPYPDLVYNRYFGHQFSGRDELIKKLISRGAVLVNSAMPNKWACYQLLKTDPLLKHHLPETRLCKSIKDIAAMIALYPEIYIKPRAGARGTGIYRLSHNGRFYQLISSSGKVQKVASLDKLPPHITNGSSIVQQGIRLWNYPHFFDFKVLVQSQGPDFRVTGKVARQAEPGRVTTHLHQGGRAVLLNDYIRKLPPTWQEKAEAEIDGIALQTARVLQKHMKRLGEFSIDMGIDYQGKVWIIEVNGKPSRKSFLMAGDLETRSISYEYLIDYILYDYVNNSR